MKIFITAPSDRFISFVIENVNAHVRVLSVCLIQIYITGITVWFIKLWYGIIGDYKSDKS